MIPQRSKRPSIAGVNEQLDPRFAASRHTTVSISHTRTSQTVARKPLLISRPMDGRRLSWPEHTVGYQLAQGCLQMTAVRIEPQLESYESTPTTRHLHLQRQVPGRFEQLEQGCYLVAQLESNTKARIKQLNWTGLRFHLLLLLLLLMLMLRVMTSGRVSWLQHHQRWHHSSFHGLVQAVRSRRRHTAVPSHRFFFIA